MKLTELLEYLSNAIPVVAVNRRLARRLISDFDSLQVKRGLIAWNRPPVYTYEAWLKVSLQHLDQSESLLSTMQAQRVWETILSDDIMQSGVSLLQVPQSAKMAMAAHQLLIRYEVTFSKDEGAADHASFLRWQEAWIDVSKRKNWFDSSELPRLITDAIESASLPVPDKVVFAGFDNLSPVDRRLRSSLQKLNCHVINWELPESTAEEPKTVQAADRNDEVRRCARWANAILQSDPSSRVVIVTPQLEQYQLLFQSAFLSEVDP